MIVDDAPCACAVCCLRNGNNCCCVITTSVIEINKNTPNIINLVEWSRDRSNDMIKQQDREDGFP